MSYAETIGPELVIEHTGQVFSLTQEPVTLGREADNTLVLADPEVSGHHALISWQDDLNIYVIEDLGSTNGTYVNERLIAQPEPLREGDAIRVGDTIINVHLQPVVPEPDDTSGNLVLPGVIVALLAGITVACLCLTAILLLTGGRGVPNVTIQSPADGAEILVGNEILLQAMASGADDITLLELSVDGALVATATSDNPAGASTLSASKAWIFDTLGEHTVSAVARTAEGKTSKTESVEITAVSLGEARPSATPTPAPGEPTETPMLTATPTLTPEPGAPQIEFFRADPQSITAGECTTLEWGAVTDATAARIDPDVGGVATPGSTQVCPRETTTYVLTAQGPGGTTTASTTVSVTGALADLTIDSIIFDPDPAVENQDTEVRITIRNAGPGSARAFRWDWQAGSEAYFDGRLRGLGAGQSTVVTVRWKPASANPSLSTEARVDVDNEVPESDESNNHLVAAIQVVEDSSGGGTVTLTSESTLDGYRANDGSGSNRQDILMGNGENVAPTLELVWRGFMSFDLRDIPAGATMENAELRFFQAKVGGDPYGKLGNLMLDHVYFGDSLDANAFDTPALDSAMLPQQTSAGTWYILSGPTLGSWVKQDLAAGRPHFQLRLRFAQETDGDGEEDYVGVESANNFFGTGNAPLLTLTYGP